tara:strand:- start:75 stop:350 length:276 start_codon:yes stop_codon:yes gene_type:complete
MTSRKPIADFKNTPHIGIFQYMPSVLRHHTNLFHLLPGNNPYVGYYNHSHKPMYIEIKTRDASTQTDPDPTMMIGKKVIEAYGEDYEILLK